MGTKQIRSRCTFGSTLTDIDALLTERTVPPPVKGYNPADYGFTGIETDVNGKVVNIGDTWVNCGYTDHGGLKTARRDSYHLFILERILTGNLQDVMVYFWMNHFGVDADTVIEPNFMYQYYLTIRNNAFGNFRELVRQVSLNSAMMVRLNADTSRTDDPSTPAIESPNLNFARELLELFTLGVGNYTEWDIREAARVMTGFDNDYSTTTQSRVTLSIAKHNKEDKVFSSLFNNYTILGAQTAEEGPREVRELINMIFGMQRQTVAKFICRKLYRFFIHAELNDSYVADMVNVLIANNWEIKPLLRFMLTSAHFHDAGFTGSIVKAPVEMMANAIRDFKVKFPVDVVKKAASLNKIRRRLIELQDAGNPPSIAGWSAYRQSPDFDEVWFNNSSGMERDKILLNLFNESAYAFYDEGFWIDVFALARSYNNPADPLALTREALDVLPFTFTDAEVQAIKNECLLNGGTNNMFWTNAWNGYLAGNAANTQTVKDNLTKLFRRVIADESYQLK